MNSLWDPNSVQWGVNKLSLGKLGGKVAMVFFIYLVLGVRQKKTRVRKISRILRGSSNTHFRSFGVNWLINETVRRNLEPEIKLLLTEMVVKY